MKKIILALSLIYGFQLQAQNTLAKAELEAQNVSEVQIRGSFVDVYVKKGDRVYFKGEINGNGDEGDYRFDTEIVGATLIVKVEYTKNKYNWKSYRTNDSRIDLTITAGVKLDIDNSSGDVFISYLDAEESRIEASSGDITIKDAVADLDIETSSGDIELENVKGSIEVESSSGDQELFDINGDIDAEATSGDITVAGFLGDLELKATSGDLEFRKGKGSVEARTTSGEIDGAGVELTGNANFDATSGNVDVNFVNPLEELSFDLSASSGDLEVGGRSSEKRLVIDRGGYKVRGVTSSGDQEYD